MYVTDINNFDIIFLNNKRNYYGWGQISDKQRFKLYTN